MFPGAATVRTIVVSRHELPNGRSEFTHWGPALPPQEGFAVFEIGGLGPPVMRSFVTGSSPGQPTAPMS